MGVLCNHGASGNNGVLSHNTSIHDNTSHSNKHIIFYGTTVYNSIMTNGYVISDLGSITLIGAVNHRAILNIDFVTQSNGINISSNYGIKPDTTMISSDHISDNSSVLGYVDIFPKLRGLSIDCFNNHTFNFQQRYRGKTKNKSKNDQQATA